MPLPQVDEMSILKIVNFYNKWIDLDVIKKKKSEYIVSYFLIIVFLKSCVRLKITYILYKP